jgi:hypothetical protein
MKSPCAPAKAEAMPTHLLDEMIRVTDKYTPQDWVLLFACLVLVGCVVVMAKRR